ncbi:MAG: DUF4013 domain-containing protein [Polyangiales bacterium]
MQYLSGLDLAKRDPDWTKKIALCGVLFLSAMCIPFFGQFVVTGWLAAMVQRTARGQEDLLPRLDFEFDYLIRLATTGFRLTVVQFVWMLAFMPIMIVCYACIGGGAYAGSQMGESGGIVSMLCSLVGSLMMLICMIPFGLAVGCANIRAQLTDNIGTGLQFKPAFAMAKVMWKEQILGGIVLSFVFFGLYLAGVIACGIGVLFTLPLGLVIMTNYNAHLYREYVARGGEAVNIAHIPEADPQGSSVGPRPQAF